MQFGFDLNIVEYYMEVWTGDHVKRGQKQMPDVFAIQELNEIAYRVLQERAPMKLYVRYETKFENGSQDIREKIITNKAWDNSHSDNR